MEIQVSAVFSCDKEFAEKFKINIKRHLLHEKNEKGVFLYVDKVF